MKREKDIIVKHIFKTQDTFRKNEKIRELIYKDLERKLQTGKLRR